MEDMGLKFTPVIARYLWGILSMFLLHELIASANSPNEGFNLPPAAHPPLHLPHPLSHFISDITVVLKKVAQNPAVLAS